VIWSKSPVGCRIVRCRGRTGRHPLTVVGDREVLVTGDRDLIFGCHRHLVDNAIKHGRAGGEVSSRTKTPMVTGHLDRDDGPGFPRRARTCFQALLPARTQSLHAGKRSWAQSGRRRRRLHGARIEMLDNSAPVSSSNFGFQRQPVSRDRGAASALRETGWAVFGTRGPKAPSTALASSFETDLAPPQDEVLLNPHGGRGNAARLETMRPLRPRS